MTVSAPFPTTESKTFATALPNRGRLLGLDVGTKTIGLALCDARWTIASPAETITRTKFMADVVKLKNIMTREKITGLVIGLPLNMDATDSPRTQSVRAFARTLLQQFDDTSRPPLLLWDERWSTQAVTRTLIDADTTRARRAVLVDKLAAAYILQGAVDRLQTETV
jgi:putative holliday junction resolvase